MARTSLISAHDVVRVWQTSHSTQEAVDRLTSLLQERSGDVNAEFSYGNLMARKSQYLKKGVRLKEMPRPTGGGGTALDVGGLNDLIASIEGGESVEG